MTLPADRKYRYMTNGQADYIANLVEARFTPEDPRRELLRHQFQAIRTNADVSAMIEMLKEIPTLAQWERQQADAARPTEEGMYRNPATGELYRLRRDRNGELIVSKYSETGGPRRLTADLTKVVKGKWKRWAAFKSRIALSRGEIKKSWLIDAKELATDYAYAFCPFHYGPLTDAVSVILGYGKDCAEKHGLPWSEAHAQQVLAARQHQEISS
jgi:hypothetical protein